MAEPDKREEWLEPAPQRRIDVAKWQSRELTALSNAINKGQADENRLKGEAEEPERLGKAYAAEADLMDELAKLEPETGEGEAAGQTAKEVKAKRKEAILQLQQAANLRSQAEVAASDWMKKLGEFQDRIAALNSVPPEALGPTTQQKGPKPTI